MSDESLSKHLDGPCLSCRSSGEYPLNSGHVCSVCQGTGYWLTQAGEELLGFLYRQRKRIEKERTQ